MTSPDPVAIPPQAITDMAKLHHRMHCTTCGLWSDVCDGEPTELDLAAARQLLEAAAPYQFAAERVRIAMVAGELKFRLWRPGLGPGADEQMLDVVPFEQLLAALRGEGGGT